MNFRKLTVSFLDFDLSQYIGDPDIELLDARMLLTQDSRNVNTQYLQLAGVDGDWDPATVAFDQAVEDAFRFGGTNTSGEQDDKFFTIDVTDMFREWITGADDYDGFRLAFDDQNFSIATFYDSGANGPRLELSFVRVGAVPEPGGWAVMSLLAVVSLVVVRRRITARS